MVGCATATTAGRGCGHRGAGPALRQGEQEGAQVLQPRSGSQGTVSSSVYTFRYSVTVLGVMLVYASFSLILLLLI